MKSKEPVRSTIGPEKTTLENEKSVVLFPVSFSDQHDMSYISRYRDT
jgi:hypothetical protein